MLGIWYSLHLRKGATCSRDRDTGTLLDPGVLAVHHGTLNTSLAMALECGLVEPSPLLRGGCSAFFPSPLSLESEVITCPRIVGTREDLAVGGRVSLEDDPKLCWPV